MSTVVTIDPIQLAAIRAEVMPQLDAVRHATGRAALATAASTSPDYRAGQVEAAAIARDVAAAVFDRIARQGVLLIDD